MLQFVAIGFLGTAVRKAFVFTLATGGGALKSFLDKHDIIYYLNHNMAFAKNDQHSMLF